MVSLYRHQTRMAQLVGDDAGVASALHAMREAALTSGLPAVILLADRVAELRDKRRSSAVPTPAETSRHSKRTADDRSAVTRFLQKNPPGRARGREALWLLARYTGCDAVYLYRIENNGPVLVASVPDAEEIPSVTLALFNALPDAHNLQPGATLDLRPPTAAALPEGRLLMLPISDLSSAHPLIGAVVLHADAQLQPEVSKTMLRELGSIIAEDIRTTIGPTGTTDMPDR